MITAQTTLLTNQQTAVNLRMQQMTSSVQLIEALGGGWDTSQLPAAPAIVSNALGAREADSLMHPDFGERNADLPGFA